MQASLRKILIDSHVAAVTIAVLLFYRLSSLSCLKPLSASLPHGCCPAGHTALVRFAL